jgi:hypothetical protein
MTIPSLGIGIEGSDAVLDEPIFESLPTSEDFYYDGDVDEKRTREHYLGKDIEFACKRYRSLDSLSVLHDWGHVGVRAFRYYIFGACRYLQNEKSRDDADVFNALAELLIRKLVEHPQELKIISAYIAEFSQWAIDNYEKFGVTEYEDIYGDVKEKYRKLREAALQLSGHER